MGLFDVTPWEYFSHPSFFLKTAQHEKGVCKGGKLMITLKVPFCLAFSVSVLSLATGGSSDSPHQWPGAQLPVLAHPLALTQSPFS